MAAQLGLCWTWSETLKTVFFTTRLVLSLQLGSKNKIVPADSLEKENGEEEGEKEEKEDGERKSEEQEEKYDASGEACF